MNVSLATLVRCPRTGREAAGGIVAQDERAPGVPFARFADPDGNVLEM